MSQLDNVSNSIVYVDFQCNSYSGTTPVEIGRQITRTTPILDRQGDYYCAVARANFPQVNIPFWIPDLLIGQTVSPPRITNYFVSLSYNGFNSAPSPLLLILYPLNTNYPPVPLLAQPTSDYAFVRTMTTIISMLNSALAEAFDDLAAQTTLPALATAPYFDYDAATELTTFNAYPFIAYNNRFTPATPVINVYFSASYIPYLNGYDILINNDNLAKSAANSYRDVQLLVQNTQNNFQDILSTNPTVWAGPPGFGTSPAVPRNTANAILTLRQSFVTAGMFRALQRIQIISQGLSASLENVDNIATELNSRAQDATSSILADFTPDYTSMSSFQDPQTYTPSSIIPGARFIELVGQVPLVNCGLYVRWLDANGTSRPMYVNSLQQIAGVKLVFVRREVLLGKGDY